MCRSDGHREMPFLIMRAVKKRKPSSLGIHLAVVACRDKSSAHFAVAPIETRTGRNHESARPRKRLRRISIALCRCLHNEVVLIGWILNQGCQRKTIGLESHAGWTFLSDLDSKRLFGSRFLYCPSVQRQTTRLQQRRRSLPRWSCLPPCAIARLRHDRTRPMEPRF